MAVWKKRKTGGKKGKDEEGKWGGREKEAGGKRSDSDSHRFCTVR